jgi:hypothetical protein
MNPAQKLLIGVFVSILALHANSVFAQSSESGAMNPQSKIATGSVPQSRAFAPTGLSEASKEQMLAGYGRLPLSFEANEGQTNSDFQFISHGNGYSLFLASGEAVLALRKSSTKKAEERLHQAATAESEKTEEAVLGMKMVGASATAKVAGLEELPGKSNYFTGSDPAKWVTKVPNYARVEYEDIYPGVDLVYYGNQRQLEYDFVVAPGADPRAVVLQFAGAKKLAVDGQGDLVLTVQGGEVRFKKPVVYQVLGGIRQSVAGKYVLVGAYEAGFEVGRYDAARPLILDPTLVYSTYLGGSNTQGNGIAVDSSGNAYVVGGTSANDFPTTAGVFQTTNPGGTQAFVTKMNAAGTALVYSTYLGGSIYTVATSIAVDSSGAAYITGVTQYAGFATTAGAFQTAPGAPNAQNGFVTKLSADGSSLIYSTYLGGSTDGDFAYCIGVDSTGAAYVTGGAVSSDFPITAGSFQTTLGGGENAFVTKLKADGSGLVYSTFLGGSNIDFGQSIALDSSGNAYVTGRASSTNFPTTAGAWDTYLGGSGGPVQIGTNAFVTKLNATGSALVYSTYLGGVVYDWGNGIAVDSSGSAYVTGGTQSYNFPATTGAFQTALKFPTTGPGSNAFVTKLKPDGSGLVYSTFLGGGTDVGQSIAVDSAGSAYLTGSTGSTDFPTTPNAFQSALGGTSAINAFVTELSADASTLTYSTFLGGNNFDVGNGIALDSAGSFYVAGYASSSNFPTTPGAYQTTFGPVYDAFIAKFAKLTSPAIAWPTPTPITFGTPLSGAQLDATANVAGTFVYSPPGNTVLNAGTQTLSATFTPMDTADYSTASASVNLVVNQAIPAITWSTPAAITYGTALSGAQLDAMANVAGSFAYTPGVNAVLRAGPQTLSVNFTPNDMTDYASASDSVTLTVNKATPAITWPTPAAITYGTALSGAQLDATANVAGSFVYTPGAGSVLPPGSQLLSVTFTPTDNVDYTTATASVSLAVNDSGNLTISNGQTYTFVKGRVSGNILMTGGTLVLNNSVVGGNLQMSGGNLLFTNNSTVQGNLQTSGSSIFSIGPGTIAGNLQVQNIPAGAAQNQVCGATVSGNLQVLNNGTATLIGSPTCAGNSVSGNLQVSNNSASVEVYGNAAAGNIQIQNNAASTAIFNNSSRGILQCSGNNSSLIKGGGNTAALKQGQCAGF